MNIRKRILSLLLILCLSMGLFSYVMAESQDREEFIEGNFTYTLLPDGTAEITKWSGSDETLDIPSQLNGYPVTSIGDSAFYGCRFLTSITIPESVTSIGNGAFWNCTSLTSITLPEGVTSIGDSAFFCCYSLSSIALPDSITRMSGNPFASCDKLITITVSPNHPYLYTVDGVLFSKPDSRLIRYPANLSDTKYAVPQGVTSIGDQAFWSCVSLTSVNIPEGVTSIGDYAFFCCYSLSSIALPDSITHMGINPFIFSYKLTTITVSPNHPYLYTVDGVLFSKSDNRLICCLEGLSATEYAVPQGVTSIGDEAFSDCDSLTLTVTPNSYAHNYAEQRGIAYRFN